MDRASPVNRAEKMSRKSSLDRKMSFESGLGWFCIYTKPIIYRKSILREF
jgi:hypothetical protein